MKSRVHSKWSKVVIILSLMIAFLLGGARSVQAAMINQDGVVGVNEVIDDDIFLSNQNVKMDGTVNGNLFASGATIIINGPINGDAFLTGQNVVITDKARISGNLFIGGQSVDISGRIGGSVFGGASAFNLRQGAVVSGNLYYGGYHLLTETDTIIDRDVFVGSYQSILNGTANRNINISAAAIEITGTVGKNAIFNVANPGDAQPSTWQQFMPQGMPAAIKPGLRISREAKINGQLTYTSAVEQPIAIATQPQGGIIYQTPVPGEANRSSQPSTSSSFAIITGNVLLDILRDFFTLLVLGGLVLWLQPAWLKKTEQIAYLKPVNSAGVGLAVIILGYIAAGVVAVLILFLGILLSIITLGGLSNAIFGVGFSSLAAVIAIFTLVVSYGSKLVVTCLVGGMIIHKIAPRVSRPEIWGMVTGVFLLVIFQAIPILGFLINILVTIMGMGAIWLLFTNRKMPRLVEVDIPAV